MSGYNDNRNFGDAFASLQDKDVRLTQIEATLDLHEKAIKRLETLSQPLVADDRTVYAMQQEIYKLKSQLNEIQQYIFLINRAFNKPTMRKTTASGTFLKDMEGLGVRTVKSLNAAGIYTFGQLAAMTRTDLLKTRGIGKTTMEEIGRFRLTYHN